MLLLAIMINCTTLMAQKYWHDMEATVIKNYENLQKGQKIEIAGVAHNFSEKYLEDRYFLFYKDEPQVTFIDSSIRGKLQYKIKTIDDFWNVKIIERIIPELMKRGLQYDLRADMEMDALEFINRAEMSNYVFYDPYLEDYIYRLIAKIAPSTMLDGRPCNVNLVMLKDPTINASMYSNGTLVINTGLISCLHSEEELAAVIAHEVAHFVLDHSVNNVNSEIDRKKRAEFWSGVATAIAGIAEVTTVALNPDGMKSNPYYVPGDITCEMAKVCSEISNRVIDRLGMKYNHKQEAEADMMAMEVLEFLGYDKNALCTTLTRMANAIALQRSNSIYFDTKKHQSLDSRIASLGVPNLVNDHNYEKTVSFAVTASARMKYGERRFKDCLSLVRQNIANNVATMQDYVLCVNCMLSLYDSSETNSEALELINMAKTINPNDFNLLRTEILVYLRQKNNEQAKSLMQNYASLLNQSIEKTQSDVAKTYLYGELEWVNNMKLKIDAL